MQRIDALFVINGIQDLLNKNKKKQGSKSFDLLPLIVQLKKIKGIAGFFQTMPFIL